MIRQSKETLGRRLTLDQTRDRPAPVVQSWGQLEAGKAQVVSAQSQATALETALNGVRRNGRRAPLDVLNAQALVNAGALVTAQHDHRRVLRCWLRSAGWAAGARAATDLRPDRAITGVRDSWGGYHAGQALIQLRTFGAETSVRTAVCLQTNITIT